jgi:hypothetical protein
MRAGKCDPGTAVSNDRERFKIDQERGLTMPGGGWTEWWFRQGCQARPGSQKYFVYKKNSRMAQ